MQNGDPKFAYLTHQKFAWTHIAIGIFPPPSKIFPLQTKIFSYNYLGPHLVEVHLSNLVGVTNAVKNELGFVLHVYPIVDKNRQRAAKYFEFIAPDKETKIKWITMIRKLLPHHKKLLVIVNPYGGKGTAKKIWNQVHPMFIVANIKMDIIGTHADTHSLSLVSQLHSVPTTRNTKGRTREGDNDKIRSCGVLGYRCCEWGRASA